jgi:hypothetical protein
MERDRDLAARHSDEHLDQVADEAMSPLAESMDTWLRNLRQVDTLPPPPTLRTKFPISATFILITSGSVKVSPSRPLLFVPNSPSDSGELPNLFKIAEQLEFRDKQYERAIRSLKLLADQPGPRPEALLRIARLERKLNHPADALATYERLWRETAALNSSGAPYALLAAVNRCELFSEAGDSSRAKIEADAAYRALPFSACSPSRAPLTHCMLNLSTGLRTTGGRSEFAPAGDRRCFPSTPK